MAGQALGDRLSDLRSIAEQGLIDDQSSHRCSPSCRRLRLRDMSLRAVTSETVQGGRHACGEQCRIARLSLMATISPEVGGTSAPGPARPAASAEKALSTTSNQHKQHTAATA